MLLEFIKICFIGCFSLMTTVATLFFITYGIYLIKELLIEFNILNK